MNSNVVTEGIEVCEDLCKCGGNLRLHTYIFGKNTKEPKTKHYVDCPCCGLASEWKDSVDGAIEDFDLQAS